METVKTLPNKAQISMGLDKILKIDFLPKSDIDVNDAKEIVRIAGELSGSIKHVNLVDMRKMTFINNEARKHFAQQDKSTVYAIGVVINSKVQRSLVNLYFKFNQPIIPTKMFDTPEDAIAWLKTQIK